MIQKQKLIASVSKKAKISIAKATTAYETILKESPSWKKQSLKTVKATTEVAVAVPGKLKIKEVKLSKQKAVKTTNKVEKIKKVEVVKEVPVTVIKEVIKKVEVKVEVPVEVIKEVEVVKEVEVIKEVPVVVEKVKIKEVKVEKKVPVEVIKEVTMIKEVTDEKEVNKWKTKSSSLEKSLASAKKQMADLKKSYDKKLQDLNKKLAAKPKVITKEIEIIKEVPVEIIKEVEVVKSIDFSTLESMMKNLGTVEVSKKVIGETRTARASKVVERREIKEGTSRSVVTGKSTKTTKKKSSTSGKKTSAKKASAKKATAKKASSKKAVAKKVVAKKVSSKKTVAKKDNLTKIEGIGPKIAQLLNAGKISSFSDLSKAKTATIQAILDKAGPRFQMHNPGSWAKQAGLAASGKWKELEKLQSKLDGGK